MQRRACLLPVVLLWASASAASAQDRAPADPQATASTASVPGYTEAVERGFSEFQLGNYAEARSHFVEADQLHRNARVLRALGMVEFELRDYVSSIAHLEQALASTERPLTPAQRTETEALLERARGYVARYEITLVPRQATLLVDGVEVTRDRRGGLLLPVGEHTLDVRAEGHLPARRVLQVTRGSEHELTIVLLTAPRPEPVAVRQPLYKKWWLWTAVGSVVAAGATAGIVVATRDAAPSGVQGSSGAVLTIPALRERP